MALRSRVKHSSTEPPGYLKWMHSALQMSVSKNLFVIITIKFIGNRVITSPMAYFLADFIAVIRLHSLCQKVSFSPIFGGKFPIYSQRKIQRKILKCSVLV